MLSADQRKALLQVARDAIAACVGGVAYGGPLSPDVVALRGRAFVTLHRGDELRGCIGHIRTDALLVNVIRDCAVSASRSDPRFPPVTASEIALLEIEVSVLGPIEPVTHVDEIEIGRHGTLVEMDGRRGLLLPQVAADRLWTRETLLAHTCEKAGLARDAWRHGALIWRFEAEVFSEAAELGLTD
jgi:AmmeMemoRadiSam system protein A